MDGYLTTSLIINFIFYIMLGYKLYQNLIEDYDKLPIEEQQGYKSFAFVMSVIWPFVYLSILFDKTASSR